MVVSIHPAECAESYAELLMKLLADAGAAKAMESAGK